MLLREQENLISSRQKKAPVKVVALAHDLGLKVYTTRFESDDISGMIRKSVKKGQEEAYEIIVNADHSETRRRFTIAHEIAHYILHQKLIGDGIVEDALLRSGGMSNSVERQANSMAADILMPWSLINQAEEEGLTTVSALASYLNVSRDAMSYRLLGVPFEDAKASGRA